MFSRLKLYRVYWLTLLAVLVLAACGDPTATSQPAAAPTTAPTTAAATTAAATTAVATTAAATTAAATTAATTAAATTAAGTTVALSADAEAGRQIFVQNCAGCHLQEGRAAGRAPQLSTSQNALNADFVRTIVRNGKGQMPPVPETRITNAQLDSIIVYLKAIH